MPGEAETLTAPEAALQLGVGVQAVYDAIRTRRLPARRRAGEYAIARADFDQWARERERTLRRQGRLPDTVAVRVAYGPEDRSLYVRHPGARGWRRFCALPDGAGELVVDVPMGVDLALSEREGTRIRPNETPPRPVEGGSEGG